MKNLKFIDYGKDNYKKNSEDFYESIDRKLDYLQSQMNHVLTEQEKQRLSQMTMQELLQEMLSNQKDMRETLNDVLLERGDK